MEHFLGPDAQTRLYRGLGFVGDFPATVPVREMYGIRLNEFGSPFILAARPPAEAKVENCTRSVQLGELG